jgi:hypothetical protein
VNSTRIPVKAIVTKQGMIKGHWKVIAVDCDELEIEVIERVQSKKLANELANDMNAHGSYTTGISGFRYQQQFGHELNNPFSVVSRV